MVELVRGLPAVRTLDIACSSGFLTRHLNGLVVGLDQSRSMAALARSTRTTILPTHRQAGNSRDCHPPLTYPQVAATGTGMPTGYHTIEVAQPVGTVRAWFDVAIQRLMTL